MRSYLLAGIAAALAASPAIAAPRCTPPVGLDEIAAAGAHYIVLGEQHGTQEAPAMAGDIACALAEKGEHVLLALELANLDNAAFQAAWRGPSATFGATMMRTMHEWSSNEGGPASQALFDTLVRLQAIRQRGGMIDVVGFSGPSSMAQMPLLTGPTRSAANERMQAENIRRAADAGHYSHVVVLVGNLHARKAEIVRQALHYDPMAKLLAAPGDVLSFDLGFIDGTAYNCQLKRPSTSGPITRDMIDCGPHALRGGPDLGKAPRIALTANLPKPATLDAAYDGVLWVGRITASPPIGKHP